MITKLEETINKLKEDETIKLVFCSGNTYTIDLSSIKIDNNLIFITEGSTTICADGEKLESFRVYNS